ncbi:tRNA (adenine(22)-N(1))-methyltransferase TrmK [Candidatus Pacearchaeota archaeon]|nr:tRNA (adenine(22)-N(1))-methyltransferase TrmK [Candidatus Pacearchaeota archaeon]
MNNDIPHENTLKFIKDIQARDKRIADFLGEKIIINKNVFPVDSSFSFSSKITAKRIPKNPGVVLDVGTGTGVQAIIAAKNGASKVLAIDIDDNSLLNAQENIKYHKLENTIELRKSNLFQKINLNEKFDLIISQIPLSNVDYKSPVGHFLFDADFKIHEELLRGAKNHLNSNGKILIPSGDVADEPRLNELIRVFNYKILEVIEENQGDLIWKLYILGL